MSRYDLTDTQRLWTESPQVVSERLKIVSAKKLTRFTKTSDNIYISVILSAAEGSCQTISYLTSVRSFGCAQDDKIISLKSCTKSAQFLLADWDNKIKNNSPQRHEGEGTEKNIFFALKTKIYCQCKLSDVCCK